MWSQGCDLAQHISALTESLRPSGLPGQEREVGVQGVLEAGDERHPSGHGRPPSGPVVLPGWCPVVWSQPCQEVSP